MSVLEHERNYRLGMDAAVSVLEHERNYRLGMDAAVSVLEDERNYRLGMDAAVSVLEHERNYRLGMDAAVSVLEHERNYRLGMDAAVSVLELPIAAGSTTLPRRFRAEGAQNCGLNSSVIWPAQGIPHVVSCGATSGLRAKPGPGQVSRFWA